MATTTMGSTEGFVRARGVAQLGDRGAGEEAGAKFPM